MSFYVKHSRYGEVSRSEVSVAYSTNIELDNPVELNEFSKQVCESYLMYGSDCYSKEHTNVTDEDFSHCDYIVVINKDEQKEFYDKKI